MLHVDIEVEDQVPQFLAALALVRGVEVNDLIGQALRHLRVTEAERQRVAFYRYVEQTGTDRA